MVLEQWFEASGEVDWDDVDLVHQSLPILAVDGGEWINAGMAWQ